MRRILVVGFTFFLSAVAPADDLGLVINGKSFHLGAPPGTSYNEENWGVGLQYEWSRPSNQWRPFMQAGGFIDSNRNHSYYTGLGLLHVLKPLTMESGSFTTQAGIYGFVMSRRFDDKQDIIVGVIPLLSARTDYIAFNLAYIPKYRKDISALYFLQVVLPLGEN